MTKLAWGTAGTRTYEAGVDRGVLYVSGFDGVAWNGLTKVSEKPSGGGPTAYYLDGIKYLNISSDEEFEATIEAFSSPVEFAACDGSTAIYSGLFITQQPRKSFNLTYRTKIGNDTAGQDYGYKIHLVYNALAAPATRDNATIGDSTSPNMLSWGVTTTPPAVGAYKPTAHMVIDSTKTDPDLLAVLEAYLYGANGMVPRMPTPTQLVTMFGTWIPLGLAQPVTVLGALSNTVSTLTNLMTTPSFEAVTAGTTVVRTNLATNPSFETGLAGANVWAGTGGTVAISRVIAGGLDNGGFFRETWTVASTVSGGLLFEHGAVLQPNTKYTFSAMLRSSVAQTISPYGNFYNGSTIGAGIPKNKSFVLPANVWTRIDIAAVSGPTDVTVDLNFYGDNLFPIGATLDLDQILVEQTDQLRPYFDGNTPDALGVDYGWTGAAAASTSTAKAQTSAVRTNGSLNPRCLSGAGPYSNNSATWAITYMTSGVPIHPLGITTALRANVVAGQTSPAAANLYNLDALALTGAQRMLGVWVLSEQPGYQVNTSGGYLITALTAGVWTFVKTISATAAAAYSGLNVGKSTGNAASTDFVWITGVIAENGTLPVVNYFDGSTPNAGDFINSWTGTANTSTSAQSGVALLSPARTSYDGVSYVIASREWAANGTRSFRIIPKGTSYSYAYFLKSDLGLIAGKTYTVMVKLRLAAPQTGSLDSGARSLQWRNAVYVTSQGANISGVQELRITFTVDLTGSPLLLFFNGSAVDDSWWDGLTIIEGVYTGPYFDGDSADFVYRNQVVNPGWSGVAHSSTTDTPYLTELPLAPTPGLSYIIAGNLWVANAGTWTNYGPVPGGLV